ncbi:MAG: hypothetical protein ACUVR0_08385 [Candidatus Aminicenantales bacterium]
MERKKAESQGKRFKMKQDEERTEEGEGADRFWEEVIDLKGKKPGQ